MGFNLGLKGLNQSSGF